MDIDPIPPFLKKIANLRIKEESPPEKEEEPFAQKYEVRKEYIKQLQVLENSEKTCDSTIFMKAILLSNIARNHFDTDENFNAGCECKRSLKLWAKLQDPILLFRGVNWICMMLNFLGFHAVFGERFYEGVLLLDAAEKVYWAVKMSIRRTEEDFSQGEEIAKEIRKLFLEEGVLQSGARIKIGEFLKTVLGTLEQHVEKIQKMASDPEQEKESSELIYDTRNLIKGFKEDSDGDFILLSPKALDFTLETCEENYVQSVFFQAQVYGKLMEKDLSAEYCGLTLQRQYFKFLLMKQRNEKNKELTNPKVQGFDYKDFINNSMGLCMYYSEKLMYRQGARLLELANEVLGKPVSGENEELSLLRASLKHMKANVLRDFFMFTCMFLKEEGQTRKESKKKKEITNSGTEFDQKC